jgi:hypothetical protein
VTATDEHGGYSTGDPFRRRCEDAEVWPVSSNETPVDLVAVQADDALLDLLGGHEPGRSLDDAVLARVLMAWRRDGAMEPAGELVDVDTAVRVVQAVRSPRRPAVWVRLVRVLRLVVTR